MFIPKSAPEEELPPPEAVPPEDPAAATPPAGDPDQLIASIEQQLNQLRAALAGVG